MPVVPETPAPGPAGPTGGRILRRCVRDARGPLAASVGSAIVRQLAFLAMPYLLGRAVSEGLATGDPGRMTYWLTWFVVAVLVEAVGVLGWMWWANLAEARLAAGIRADLLDIVLRDPDADLSTGDLTARAMDDVDRILTWIHGLATWVVIAVTVVVLVPGIARMDPRLLVVVLVTAAVLAVLNVAMPRRFGPRLARLARTQGERSRTVEELLSAVLPLRGVGGEPHAVARHHAASAEVTERVRAVARLRAGWDAWGGGLPLLGIGAGLAVGGAAALDGRLDVGELTTFALWMGTVQVATGAIVARLGDRSAAVAGADRIAQVLARRPAGPPPGSAPVAEPGAALVLAGVRTARGPAAPVDLVARPGEWIAVTGPTGCGKSSLLRALAGRTPYDGRVRLGHLDLAVVGEDRSALVRLVGQSPRLLYGTVRDNLLLGAGPSDAPDPGDEELLVHCRTALFDAVLDRLPDGLDTVVGERGSTLSGGERQRLALARALVRRAPVLLLDDVSSALDAGTEAALLLRLRAATGDRVVLWTGHRSAVHVAADRVVALDGVRTAEASR